VCTVYDEILVNVAYMKNSFQVSTYNNHGAYLANDGDRYEYSYVQSQYAVNPWWAVDLGRPTVVYQINFTNTAEPHGRFVVSSGNDRSYMLRMFSC